MEPSKRIIEDANQVFNVTDTKGRKIEFRTATALDTLRLLKAAGPELSANEAWLSMAILAFIVIKIDELPLPQPLNEKQIENNISRLGDVGITAVVEALDGMQNSDEASLGNLPGTQF